MSAEIISAGKYVSLSYAISDLEGNLLEQSELPVNYVHGGATELIGGMDKVVLGMSAGDEIALTLGSDEAFGEYRPELTFTDYIENVPSEIRHLGAELQMQNEEGEIKSFIVTKIEDGRLTVDGNHPLAGKALSVRIKILEVRDATPEDQLTNSLPRQPKKLN
jgi:FKBP-type peptidyl-prolyl cis-trans isomerase SlyD